MSREVFVDTSAWIAVSDAGDKYHPAARAAYQRLLGERRAFLTTNLVIAETYIIIRRSGGHAQAMRLLGSLRSSPRLEKVWSDASLENQAEAILEKHSDQDFSFTDAVSIVVMQERDIEEAFTFDSHFAAMGFRTIPASGS
jgi:predicted nucleic acid-binding protein